MRRRILFLGMMLFFAMAWPASAQVTGFGNARSGPISVPSSIPSFFAGPLAKPDFSAVSAKPHVAGPLNLTSMMPSFSNLGNSVMLRNFFSPQMTVLAQRQAPTPTPTKAPKYTRKNSPFLP